MADINLQKNIGGLVDVKALASSLSWTAGGASDSVTWTGISIDRMGNFSTGGLPKTMDVDIFYDATLGSGNTLSVYLDVQSASDNSTWTDYATEAATVIATGPSGGGRVVGVARFAVSTGNNPEATPGVDLAGAYRYLRLLTVPHMNRTGTDTAVIGAVGVFAGFDYLPSPAT